MSVRLSWVQFIRLWIIRCDVRMSVVQTELNAFTMAASVEGLQLIGWT